VPPIIIRICVARLGKLCDKALHNSVASIARTNKMLISEQLVAQQRREHLRAAESETFVSALVRRILDKPRSSFYTHFGDCVGEHLAEQPCCLFRIQCLLRSDQLCPKSVIGRAVQLLQKEPQNSLKAHAFGNSYDDPPIGSWKAPDLCVYPANYVRLSGARTPDNRNNDSTVRESWREEGSEQFMLIAHIDRTRLAANYPAFEMHRLVHRQQDSLVGSLGVGLNASGHVSFAGPIPEKIALQHH